MLNLTIIQGRLTARPELKTTQSGVSVTTFTVACERSYVKSGEERQVDFINIVAWRQTAEFITRFFDKGQQIIVNGSLQTRNYEDKQGNKRTAFEVIAQDVYFCDKKSDSKPDTKPVLDEEPDEFPF